MWSPTLTWAVRAETARIWPRNSTRWRPAAARGCCSLGDLFHLWIGSRRFETSEVRRLASAIRGLRKRGIRVSYVEGNRDFFVADGAYADLFDDCGREVRFDDGGVRYLAVHGDGLNPRDWRYRWWRRLSKNAASRWLTFRAPRAVGRRVAASAERGLARTNREHKERIPEAVVRRLRGRGGWRKARTCSCSATSTPPAGGASAAARCGSRTPGSTIGGCCG